LGETKERGDLGKAYAGRWNYSQKLRHTKKKGHYLGKKRCLV